MKILAWLIVGCLLASASSDVIDKVVDEVVSDLFDLGDNTYRLHSTKNEEGIEAKLRVALDQILENVKEALERGKTVREDVVNKLKELREKIKDLGVNAREKTRDLFEKIKEKTGDLLKNLLDKLGHKDEKPVKEIPEKHDLDKEILDLIFDAEQKDDDSAIKIEQRIRDALDKILQKIKDTLDRGESIGEDVLQKLKQLREKIKDLKLDVSEKAKDLFDKIREKAKEFLRNLLDKLGKQGKSDNSVARADINIRNIFQKLKDALTRKVTAEALKEMIEKFFGKGNELADQLLEMIKEKGDKGKQKLLDLVDRILGEKEELETRSLQGLYDKVRLFFRKLHIELNEKYVEFGEWVRTTIKEGIDESKTKIENIKSIAQEFVENAKKARKDVAIEALEFLRPYREDLGSLYDRVKDAVQEVLRQQDR